MRQFAYQRPNQAAAAVALAAEPTARYLGGGTNLVDLMKLGVERPESVVDVTALPHDFITDRPDGGLAVGAGVRNSDLAAHPSVRRRYPVLAQALLAGASGQLRNVATVGGNLLQRTRCLYFQDVSKPCNKRVPASGCPAREGEHRNLAILGASGSCAATHPSDMAVALMALDAVVHVQETNGPREIPLSDFYLLPGSTPQRETVLGPGALVTAVELPALREGTASAYRKVRERASFAFAIGSVAATLDVVDGSIRGARIALGAVAAMPWRARQAEAALLDRPAVAETFRTAAELELAAAAPLRDNGYKVPLMTELIVTVLGELTSRSSR
jgi:xanthine dehydrogenase YagS FAD-binding subunit